MKQHVGPGRTCGGVSLESKLPLCLSALEVAAEARPSWQWALGK